LQRFTGTKLKGGKLTKGVVSLSIHQETIEKITKHLSHNGYTGIEFDKNLADLDGGAGYYYFFASPQDDENFKHHLKIKNVEPYVVKHLYREPRRYDY